MADRQSVAVLTFSQKQESSQELADLSRIRLIKRPEVLKRTCLTKSSMYDRIAKGEFPPPVKIGSRAVAWVESEVQAWILEQIRKRLPPLPKAA
jgi:prophage regulatory protein